MRYRLRTLLIVLALGPPLLAALWFGSGSAATALRGLASIQWYEVQELFMLAVGFTLLTTFAIVTAALARRVGSSS